MTSILTIGAMAIAGGVMAQDTVPATPVQPAQPAVPAAELTPAQPAAPAAGDKRQATREEADSLMKSMVGMLGEINTALGKVTDKATADAAAVTLKGIKAKMEDMQKSTENMAPPSQADMTALQQQYLPEILKVSAELEQTTQKLKENKFYGSEELETVLTDNMK